MTCCPQYQQTQIILPDSHQDNRLVNRSHGLRVNHQDNQSDGPLVSLRSNQRCSQRANHQDNRLVNRSHGLRANQQDSPPVSLLDVLLSDQASLPVNLLVNQQDGPLVSLLDVLLSDQASLPVNLLVNQPDGPLANLRVSQRVILQSPNYCLRSCRP